MIPTLSFIFVNFQSAHQLRKSLDSLRAVADTAALAEYIIVNNDVSEQQLIDQIAEKYPDIIILHQDQNLGFGRANNIGAKRANGEILFFVNPDTVLIRANLPGLIQTFDFQPKAIYGMALIQSDNRRERWSAGHFPSLSRLLLANSFPSLLGQPWQAQAVRKVDWVSGAACAIRREFFLSLGGFDPSFFLYFEDVDLARRATHCGATVAVYPFIRFRHEGGGSHRSTDTIKQAYFVSQRYYYRKWRPRIEWMLLSFLHKFTRLA